LAAFIGLDLKSYSFLSLQSVGTEPAIRFFDFLLSSRFDSAVALTDGRYGSNIATIEAGLIRIVQP
jgi:hypothetical protein